MAKQTIPVLTVNELKEVLKNCFLNKKNPQYITQTAPIIWGAPGVGKSYVVNELAKELDAVVIPFFASGGDETEVDGIPVPNDEKGDKREAEYIPLSGQNFWKFPKDKMVIWLWDEINRARPEVLQSLFKMVSTYPRTIGTREIPDNVYIICCANEGEADGTITTDFNDSSFYNKFAHFKIKFEKNSFLNFLDDKYGSHKDKKLQEASKRVIHFLKFDKNEMCLDIPSDPSKTRAYPTPRSIERFILTFGNYVADYKPSDEKARIKIMYGSCIIGNYWVDELCNNMDISINLGDEESLLTSAKRIYYDTNVDAIVTKKLKTDIAKLNATQIMNLSNEIVDIFVEEPSDKIINNIGVDKFDVFLSIIDKLPPDGKVDKIKAIIERDGFVKLADTIGGKKPSVKTLLSEFLSSHSDSIKKDNS